MPQALMHPWFATGLLSCARISRLFKTQPSSLMPQAWLQEPMLLL
jgi:hypothetical protein